MRWPDPQRACEQRAREITLPAEVPRRAEGVIHELRRRDRRLSLSAYIEIALRELGRRSTKDLIALVDRYGAGLRRDLSGRAAPEDESDLALV